MQKRPGTVDIAESLRIHHEGERLNKNRTLGKVSLCKLKPEHTGL